MSALEDFRQARLELMKKFEEQEKQMAEQEVRHKETLYETKKQLIINKTKYATVDKVNSKFLKIRVPFTFIKFFKLF